MGLLHASVLVFCQWPPSAKRRLLEAAYAGAGHESGPRERTTRVLEERRRLTHVLPQSLFVKSGYFEIVHLEHFHMALPCESTEARYKCVFLTPAWVRKFAVQ